MSSKFETQSLYLNKKFEDNLKLPPVPTETFVLTYKSEVNDNFTDSTKNLMLPFASSDLFLAPITEARLLTPLGDQNVKRTFEITFDVAKEEYNFKPGDTIGLLPQNSDEEVSKLLVLLELKDKSDLTYLIVKKDTTTKKPPNHVPESSTLRYLFTHMLDIRSLLKKVFLYALSLYTNDESEKRCLEILCSKEGSIAYTEQILNRKTNLTDVLELFPSCRPPINVVIQHLPRLTPRPYSIVNSQLSNKNIIKICFSVIEINESLPGITTGFLEKLIVTKVLTNHCYKDKTEADSDNFKSIENSMNTLSIKDGIDILSNTEDPKVPIYLRKSNGFTLPDDNSMPLLMIGPGTGIAPFIGFLEERQYLKNMNPDMSFGDTWLFFGCRHPEKDFIYKDRLDMYLKDHTLGRLTTSFSRSSDHKKEYVQDKIVENSEKVVTFIENGAIIYVCGDIGSMASAVMDAIVKCYVTHKSMSQDEAEIVVKDLQKTNRYLLDIWS